MIRILKQRKYWESIQFDVILLIVLFGVAVFFRIVLDKFLPLLGKPHLVLLTIVYAFVLIVAYSFFKRKIWGVLKVEVSFKKLLLYNLLAFFTLLALSTGVFLFLTYAVKPEYGTLFMTAFFVLLALSFYFFFNALQLSRFKAVDRKKVLMAAGMGLLMVLGIGVAYYFAARLMPDTAVKAIQLLFFLFLLMMNAYNRLKYSENFAHPNA